MIIFEKLRAICQQMEEYKNRTTSTHRARDFFDIYTTSKAYVLEKTPPEEIEELKELCQNIFSIKEVDMSLLERFDEYKDFHEQSFQKVVDSVLEDERSNLKSFDFYFNETQKDYLKNEQELEAFILAKTSSDSLTIKQSYLTITNKSLIDSIAQINSKSLISNIENYIKTTQDSTQIKKFYNTILITN